MKSQTDLKALEKWHIEMQAFVYACVCDITVCLCAPSILSTQVRPLRILHHTAFTLTHTCCYYSTRGCTNILKPNEIFTKVFLVEK